jgi:hypothetical protein
VQRAKIVLNAAEGHANVEIARRLEMTPEAVGHSRSAARRVSAVAGLAARSRRQLSLFGAAFVVCLGFAGAAPEAQAKKFRVNETVDRPGRCLSHPANCSLRQAINSANASRRNDKVIVRPGRYRLTRGQLVISKQGGTLKIRGAGSRKTTIEASARRRSRIFRITREVHDPVKIRRMKLTRGAPRSCGSGGAILYRATGTLTLKGLRVTHNETRLNGGGVQNHNGTLRVFNSRIANNSAADGGGGIGNDNLGTAIVRGSTIAHNTADEGGGIEVDEDGTLDVIDSKISANEALGDGAEGGGIHNDEDGGVWISGSTVSDNSSPDGGGIKNDEDGIVRVVASTFSGNTTLGGDGGGIENEEGGTVAVTNSTISGNEAVLDAAGPAGTEVKLGAGGGIVNAGGEIEIEAGTASASSSGSSSGSGATPHPSGGGCDEVEAENEEEAAEPDDNEEADGIVNVVSSTITDNSAALGGGIADNATTTVKNSIVANNRSSGAGPDCSGTLGGSGANLVRDLSGCTLSGPVIAGVDPRLGSLQLNPPGATATQALLAGSPAIDAAVGCPPPTEDQRGVTRPPSDGSCDLGAFELVP